MRKTIYIIIGILSIVLGIIGIFVPGLPTTPFLLLSSWLFYKSSKKLHDRLHRSRWLGNYIRRYESKQGVGVLSKAISIVCMWGMISLSAFCFIENSHLRILLLVLGVIGTFSVVFIVPNARKDKDTDRAASE